MKEYPDEKNIRLNRHACGIFKSLKIVASALAMFFVQSFSQSSLALAEYGQSPDKLLSGQVMAVAYSGFREGQHPDRGDGAVNPSDEQILEDLNILAAHRVAGYC